MFLKLVHMHNLHPGCIFGHMNCLLRICSRMQICTKVQICSYFQSGANLFAPVCNLHPGANCAYERKNVYFQYVLIGDFDILQTCFVYDFVLNDIKVNFKLFLSK